MNIYSMKKIKSILMTTILLFMTNLSFCQVQQGNFIIDPYYGFPNIGENLAKGVTKAGDFDAVKSIKGIGPTGLRFEYMVAENFGVGFDFIYNSVEIDGSIDSLNDQKEVVKTYNANIKNERYRFHFRANYHFVQEEKFDAYVGFGAGTNKKTFEYTTDYKGYEGIYNGIQLSRVSGRIALGGRYYFTNNLGLNVEIGIGGPILSAGLSLKF